MGRETGPPMAQLRAASALQRLVPPLVVLAMQAEQARWNGRGPSAIVLRDLADALAADVAAWTGRVAERAAALGFAVDARPTTVAGAGDPFLAGAGALHDPEAAHRLLGSLEHAADVSRHSVEDLRDTDQVARRIAVDTLEGLDRHRWMLRAHDALARCGLDSSAS